MTKEPVIGLYPLNDCVLVELKQSSKNFTTKEGKYDTRTEGIVIRTPVQRLSSSAYTVTSGTPTTAMTHFTPVMPLKDLIGKRVHFEEFKEGARIKRDGKIYSFIKLEDIRGYENDEQTS